ncbi:MAG: hypothetical protein PHX02_06785 [Oscillospiraceae bacterium]|nr:hypothetical protein [Oscillospiraceae bacterium]
MIDWWNGLSVMHQIFYMLAIPSTVILIIQTVLLMFGFGDANEVDGDISADSETDFDAPADQGAEHGEGLRILTVRGIIAFLVASGWVGVAALDMGAGTILASLLSIIAGLGALVIVAAIFRASMKLQQSGNLDFQNAIGVTGEVYLRIPAGGRGKVTLVVQGRYVELDAICNEREVKTGEQVKVVDVTQNNTLIVSPIKKLTSVKECN